MRHIAAIFIKLLMTVIILEIVIDMFSELTIGNTVLISSIVTIITYFIGDLLILRVSKNIAATLADIVLAFVTIFLLDATLYANRLSFLHELLAAASIGLGEFYFHKYFAIRVLKRNRG